MGKGLKLRISRFIPSFLSCRSKEAYSVPESPVPLIPTPGFGSSPVDDFMPTFPLAPSSSPKQLSGYVVSQFRTAREPIGRADVKFIHDLEDLLVVEDGGFRWKKEEKWHVVSREDQAVRRKISISLSDKGDVCPPASPASPRNSCFMVHERRARSRGRGQRRKASSRSQRRSNSSAGSGWFSSEEEETETLFSKSFSSDSSDFFRNHLHTIQEWPCKIVRSSGRRKLARPRRYTARPAVSPARTSAFRRVRPWVFDGKVKDSFAVVKRSRDPYHDFMKSMMEMITEKEMFDARDLEHLLRCFLSLNAPHHHDVIVRVFSDVWDTLFSNAFPLE